jgi:hypothetical protein
MEAVERAKSRREFSNPCMEETFQLEIPGSIYPTICELTVCSSDS